MEGHQSLIDFGLEFNITLPSSNIFSGNINFKIGDDVQIISEKIFQQDGIPSIYFNNTIESTILNLKKEKLSFNQSQNLKKEVQNPILLHDIAKKWTNLIETFIQKPHKKVSIYLLEQSIKEQFMHIILFKESRNKIYEFIRRIDIRDTQNFENFNTYTEDLNKKHSQEIEEWVRENKNLEAINNSVKLHYTRLDKIKSQFMINFEKNMIQALSNFKDLIKEEYNRLNTLPIDIESISENKASGIKSQNNLNTYSINLRLGLQSKRAFKIKLKQANLTEFFKSTFKDYTSLIVPKFFKNPIFKSYKEKGIRFPIDSSSINIIKSSAPFYGINSTGIVLCMNYDSASLMNTLNVSVFGKERDEVSVFDAVTIDLSLHKSLKHRTDLHFMYYEKQIEQGIVNEMKHIRQETNENSIKFDEKCNFEGNDFRRMIINIGENYLKKDDAAKQPKEVDINQIKSLNNKLLFTKHSNLGKITTIYHLVNDTSFQDIDWTFMRILFKHADENYVSRLIIPIEAFMKGKYQLATIKNCNEIGVKIMKCIRSEINNLAHEYSLNRFLKDIVIIIPKGIDDDNALFSHSKDGLQTTFE